MHWPPRKGTCHQRHQTPLSLFLFLSLSLSLFVPFCFSLYFMEVYFIYNKMHSFYMYSLMSFNKCIYLCNTTPVSGCRIFPSFQKVSWVYLGVHTLPSQPQPGTHCCAFCHDSLLCLLNKSHRNRVIEYGPFSIWRLALSVACLRFLHIAACLSSSFVFLAE